jgi:hypothetical protein
MSEQTFEFTKENLLNMTKIWNNVNLEPEKHQVFESETLEMINDAYNGFIDYIKE